MIKNLIKEIFPQGSFRRKLVRKTLVKLHLRPNIIIGYYNVWAHQLYEHPPLRQQLRNDVAKSPKISVIVPAYNTPARYLEPLVYSIISQAYQNWELIIVNASTEPKSIVRINNQTLKDTRIKVISVVNKSIAENTNEGIKSASGTYIAFTDHDDLLDPFALYECALRIIDDQAEVVYTDEDKISDNGEIYFDPHFKPDWSPDLLTHVNYVNHLTIIKKEMILEAGLLSASKDGAQDYDLILRVTDLKPKIIHVPKILYHWRAAQNSTAQDFSSKKYVTNSGKLALEEHFERLGIKVKVHPEVQRPGFYDLEFPQPKKISLIITPFASDALLRLFIELLIKRSNHTDLKVELLLPNGAQPRSGNENVNVKVIENGPEYLRNALLTSTSPETVVISQIVFPINPDNWLQRLCAPLCIEHVGAVAPLIVRDGSVIEDCGIVMSAANERISLFKDQPAFNNQTYFGNTDWVRDVDALSGGVTAVRTEELQRFISSSDIDTPQSITDFTLANKIQSKYNLLFTGVALDNYSIRIAPKNISYISHFSPTLLSIGKDYEPYTPESAAINILLHIADQEQNL